MTIKTVAARIKFKLQSRIQIWIILLHLSKRGGKKIKLHSYLNILTLQKRKSIKELMENLE